MNTKITCLSLFSGCGGLDLGFALSGFEILAAFDHWLPAIRNHNKNKHLFGGVRALQKSLKLSDNEIQLEEYVKKIQIEARMIGYLASNHVLPSAVDYQNKLIKNIKGQKEW